MSEKQSSPSSQVQKIEPKKEEPKPIKKYSTQDAREFVLKRAKILADPQTLLNNFAEKHLYKIDSNEKMAKETEDKIMAELTELSLALSLDTGHVLMESVAEIFRGLALQMKRDLQKEYDCQSPSEKALVDQAVNSYITKMYCSKRLVNSQNFEYYQNERTNHFNFLSKEIDRSHRQFISAIETLKLMKQPSMKVNIKTNNAFVGEKQQFNNNVENNEVK